MALTIAQPRSKAPLDGPGGTRLSAGSALSRRLAAFGRVIDAWQVEVETVRRLRERLPD